MQYRDFAPTTFDTRGLALLDRQDWLVVPCTRNRDSKLREQSNFTAALERLGGESESAEIHRFKHWACGWFEIILVSPDRQEKVKAIEKALEEYPILDEGDYYVREAEAVCEYWQNANLRERIDLCTEEGESVFAARRDIPPSKVYNRLALWF